MSLDCILIEQSNNEKHDTLQ